MIDAAQHFIDGHRLRNIVVLIAVGTGQVAPAHGHNLRHDRVPRRCERVAYEGQFAHLAAGSLNAAAYCLLTCCGHSLLIETQGDTTGRVAGSEWRNGHLSGDYGRLSGHCGRALAEEGGDAICVVQAMGGKEGLDPLEEPGIVLDGFGERLNQLYGMVRAE